MTEQKPTSPNAAGRHIGANLRKLRDDRGVSLSELAAHAGLSKSTLSDLESGRGNPTVETLSALAYALDATLADLVEGPEVADVTIVRADPSAGLTGRGLDARLLHRERQSALIVETYLMRLHAGGQQRAQGHRPGTREQVYVLAGAVRVGPQREPLRLSAHDLAVYPADVPHLYASDAGALEAEILLTMLIPRR